MAEAKPHGVTGGPSDTAVGNFGTAFLASPVQFDATYTTPDQATCDDGATCILGRVERR
jgi:hypothetical protein